MAEAPASGEKNVNAVLYVNGMAEDLDRVETETGKDVLLQTGVRLSGENSTLKNGTVEIRIPDSYIKNKPTISQAESFDGPPVIARTEGEYQITCKLKELPVGSSVIAPLHFITKPYSTPNLSETVITLHVKENDETVATKQLTIVNRSVCKLEVYDREVETFDEYRPDNPTHTPSDLTKCPKITSKINFHDEYREFGLYSPQKVKVVVQLAPETYFDPEEPGNRGWMYDEKNKTLVRFFEYRQESRIWGQEVDIIYQLPNVEYKKKFQAFTYYAAALDESGNELLETKSETGIGWSTIRQKDPPTPRLYAYCETRCRNPQSSSYYYTPDNKDKISEWDISTFNHSDWRDAPEGFQQESPLIYVKDIHSIQWDEDMFLYSMTISSENLSVPKEDVEKLNHNTLWAYSRNRGWFIAGRNLQMDQKFQIPERDQDGNEICINGGIRLEFDEKIPLPHKARERKGLIIKYETKVKTEEWDSWKDHPENNLNTVKRCNFLPNASGKEGQYVSGLDSSDWLEITSGGTIDQNLEAYGHDSAYIQDTISLSANVTAIGTPVMKNGKSCLLENGKLCVILPKGWEYVNRDKISVSYENRDGKEVSKENPEIQFFYDFHGSGKQAVILELSKLKDLGYDETYTDVLSHIWLSLDAKPTYGVKQGSHQFDYYIVYDNLNGYDAYTSNRYNKDIYDLNENGSTEDQIPFASCTVRFEPNQEVYGFQTIGREYTNMNSGGLDGMQGGESFYYGFTVGNLTASHSVKSLSMLSVLPYKDDFNICAEKNGSYGTRGSAYSVSIQEPVKLLKDGQLTDPETGGYKVSYSLDTPVRDLEKNLNACTLKAEEIIDFSKVTMIRICMKEGTELTRDSKAEFIALAKIPDKSSLKDGQIAYNSFAFASSTNKNQAFSSVNYIETNKTASKVFVPVIEGTVYRDFNFDKVLTEGEQRLPGIKVCLLDESEKETATCFTDENGHYKFTEVLPDIAYRIKIIGIPEGMTFADPSAAPENIFPHYQTSDKEITVNGKIVGNNLNSQGISDPVVLNKRKQGAVMDAVLSDSLKEISVKKEWRLKDLSAAVPAENIEVELKAGQESKRMTLSSGENWQGTYRGLRTVDLQKQPVSYELREVTVIDGFYTDVRVLDNQYTVTNIQGVRPTKNLQISKEVTGKMGNKKKAFSFTVTLKKQDQTPFEGSLPYQKGQETGELTFQDGVAKISLSHGETVTLQKIPSQCIYQVKEEEENQDYYETTYNQGKTPISGNFADIKEDTVQIHVVNKRESIPTTGVVVGNHGIVLAAGTVLIGLLGYGALCMARKRRRKK